MISARAAAVPGRDDRGRGCACAKAVAGSTSRGVTTSATVRILSVCASCGAGSRRGGRPDGVRTQRPKRNTLRRSVRAVRVLPLRPKCRKLPALRRRVVTQQEFFHVICCATGRGAMSHPGSRAARRRATAVPPAVRQCGGCWIANASGAAGARSVAAKHASRNTRLPDSGAAGSPTIQAARPRHYCRRREQLHAPRRSAVDSPSPSAP